MRLGQKQILAVIAAVGVVLLIFMRPWFAPPSPEKEWPRAAAVEPPDTPHLSGAVLNVTSTVLELKNQSADPWPDVTVGISETVSFQSTYLLYVGLVQPTGTTTVALNEFADWDGRRFDPFSLKVRRAVVVAFLSGEKHATYFTFE